MSKFYPSKEFSAKAHIASFEEYQKIYRHSIENPEQFWEEQAENLTWQNKWQKVLDWQTPQAKWFIGGKINASENCLDRHIQNGRGDKIAIIFEGEPGDITKITYKELHAQVCQFANALQNQNLEKGDRVIIYMPMIVEAVVAMLACARLGLVHSVIFGGFSSESIRDRVEDSQAKAIITADGGWRRGKIIALKENVDTALQGETSVQTVIVFRRCSNEISMQSGRDIWWHEAIEGMSTEHQAPALDSEHPLFILYTSGSTGKPKGILHTTAGYLLYTKLTTKYVFDLKEEDIYWCTADIGWITGHSYIVYGPLSLGATVLLYEGAPDFPAQDRFWDIIERQKVSIFYTAPTAIRAFIKWGDKFVDKHDLSSLRLLGTVGEPINPEAWNWYHKKIGNERCPIVDTWWQTETGGHMITPLPGATPTKPGTATLPFFGIDAAVVDDDGNEVPAEQNGKLVIRKPWPSMLRTIYGDDERYKETYWEMFGDMYLAGDAAKRDKDGYFWIIGRIDDVLNVSGHRIGTAEVESALVEHTAVAESAVCGKPDDLKGSAIVAFVTLKQGYSHDKNLADELKKHVAKSIGVHCKPDEIRFTSGLPKTRSGKIMRRLLKEICASGQITGDVTTLEDFSVLESLQNSEED